MIAPGVPQKSLCIIYLPEKCQLYFKTIPVLSKEIQNWYAQLNLYNIIIITVFLYAIFF
jgi:hypothetical protein